MNEDLSRLARELQLASPPQEALCLAFGLAFASVYAYAGYAVTDPSAFEPRFDWQVRQLRELAGTPAGPDEAGVR
ncbi:MAG: hypothetical protein Q8Q73_04670 [Stagnimonas sp.]|nr:hypothetical protein [Stagnimonas sp.]